MSLATAMGGLGEARGRGRGVKGVLLVVCSIMVAAILSTGDAHKAPENFSVYNYLSIQGPNSTAGYNTVQCGQAAPAQANMFGQTYCFDMPLLAEEESLNSTLLGRVQGTFVFVAQAGGVIFVSETFTIFDNASAAFRDDHKEVTGGTFSGVGLETLGQVSSKPIVGGTGNYSFVVGVAFTTPLANGTDANGNFFRWFRYDFTFRIVPYV